VLRNGFEALPLAQRQRLLSVGDPLYLAREQQLSSVGGGLTAFAR
jgi:hypothetical protein